MTSQGSPYARFHRALRSGNLDQVRMAALELPQVGLDDALAVVLLMSKQDGERYDRAATRWLARFALERPTVELEDLQVGLVALEALPHNAEVAKQTLGQLCERHGVRLTAVEHARWP
jgi:hypothetical protein